MRERRPEKPVSFAGSLLLAHPALRDPNFRRAVVLMSVHNVDGAMGVVLNRPLGKRLGELNGDFALGALASVPIYSGGPVQTEQLLLVAWQNQPDGFRLHFGIEPDRAGQLATEEETEIRAFLGYSGWTGGQLEKEMKHETWIVTGVPGDLRLYKQDESLWRSVLGSMGEEWRLMAGEPEDTSLN